MGSGVPAGVGWAATPATAEQEGAADASGVVRARVHRPPATRPNIEQQVTQLRTYVAARDGWTIAAEHVFPGDGYSGAKLNRPGLDALRDHAARAAFDVAVVCAPDRLARNFTHQMVVLEELERRGVPVVFCDRPLTDDPHEQLVTQIRGAVAEYERTLIADRMRRGRQARLRSGQLLPRAADGTAGADPTGRPIWRATTIRQLLTNPAYKGEAASRRLRTTPASAAGRRWRRSGGA